MVIQYNNFWFVTYLLTMLSLFGCATWSDPPQAQKKSIPNLEEVTDLRAVVKRDGSVPVIIKLLNNNAVDKNQIALLKEMAGFEVSDVKKFKYVPQMAMRVDSKGLEYLIASDRVFLVQADMPNQILMSNAQVGASATMDMIQPMKPAGVVDIHQEFRDSLEKKGTRLMLDDGDHIYPATLNMNGILESMPPKVKVARLYDGKKMTKPLQRVLTPDGMNPDEFILELHRGGQWEPQANFRKHGAIYSFQAEQGSQWVDTRINQIRFRRR
jgi:hypothetical protein